MLLYHLGAHHTRQWKSYYSLLRKHSALILKASGAVLYSLPADYMLNNLAGPDVDLDLISFCIFDWQHSLQSAYTHKHRQTLLHTHTHTHIHTHTHKHTHTYIYIYIYIYIYTKHLHPWPIQRLLVLNSVILKMEAPHFSKRLVSAHMYK